MYEKHTVDFGSSMNSFRSNSARTVALSGRCVPSPSAGGSSRALYVLSMRLSQDVKSDFVLRRYGVAATVFTP
jgi:hypothetical protein